jgi:nucleoside triphosphate pyrophosphatase
MKLVLASGSVTRLRVLKTAGIDPEVVVSGVDETAEGLATAEAVAVLAERKALAVARSRPEALVLGCDSLLDLDGTSFGKPSDAAEATRIWGVLKGRSARLCTGHCLVNGRVGKKIEVATTVVRFGTPTDREISAYVESGEPLGLAGAFSIDGLGAAFVDGIDGDVGNVLGLSMPVLRTMLFGFGISLVELWDPRAD